MSQFKENPQGINDPENTDCPNHNEFDNDCVVCMRMRVFELEDENFRLKNKIGSIITQSIRFLEAQKI